MWYTYGVEGKSVIIAHFFTSLIKKLYKVLNVGASMRQLLYKNLTSQNYRKRDVSVLERVSKNGLIASSERRCLYFITSKSIISSPADIENLTKVSREDSKKKSFYVLKVHDSKTSFDKLICKFKGTFYAVVGNVVYCVVFVHSFRLRFEAMAVN